MESLAMDGESGITNYMEKYYNKLIEGKNNWDVLKNINWHLINQWQPTSPETLESPFIFILLLK